MDALKKWAPTFVTLALTLISALGLQATVAANPVAAIIVGGLYAILKGLATSPLQ